MGTGSSIKENRSKSAAVKGSKLRSSNNKINTIVYQDDELIDYKPKNKDKIAINDDIISRFIDIQAKLEFYEKNGVFEDLRIAEEEVDLIKKEKKQLEKIYKSLNDLLKKKKEEYLIDSKNNNNMTLFLDHQLQDDIEKTSADLKIIAEQYNHSKAKLETYKLNNQYAIHLYNEQMNILHSTFENEYGSELEFRLENEVKELTEQKDQLKSALIKWGYARYLLVYSYDQIRTGEQQWINLLSVQLSKTDTINYTTEVKNNLIAAYQNLSNAKTYLKNVNLPFWTDDDLNLLQHLANEIYEYMSDEGHYYFLKEVQKMRKKCAKLNEWFESVVKMFVPLVSEYSKVKQEFEHKSDQLKMERIRLLQQKVKEKIGKNVNMNVIDIVSDNDKEKTNLSLILGSFKSNLIIVNEADEKKQTNVNYSDEKKNAVVETQTENEIEIEKLKKITEISFQKTNPTLERMPSSFQLPLPPSRDQILGNLEEIKQQYKQQEKDWNILLKNSKQTADEKLKKLLEQYK